MEAAAGCAKPDAVLHLRVASIHYRQAEESAFADVEAMDKAIEHYKRSLAVMQTAEAWRNAGICAYRQACLLPRDGPEDSQHRRLGFLRDAQRFLIEANLLDNSRPQVNAWLSICAVELGRKQVAKQAIRQVLRVAERLDYTCAAELAAVLVRFSDERQAPRPADRGTLFRDGRYAA